MSRIIWGIFGGIDWLVTALNVVARVLIVILVLWVTFAVVMRYVFHNPLLIAIDTAMMMAMFVFFFPIAIDLREEIHPTISFITKKLPATGQHIVYIINFMLFAALGGLWAVFFWRDMSNMLGYKVPIELMPYIPIGLVRIPMLIGISVFTLLALSYVALGIRNLIQKRPPDWSPSLRPSAGGPQAKELILD